jgi:SAM-dependent methyltransferase
MNTTPSTCSYSMHKETSLLYWKLLNTEAGSVLDLGSGMGGFGLAKPKDVKLYGVERDSTISAKSQGYEKIVTMEIGKEKLPFEDGKFSAIIARDILEHLEHPWLVVDELYRVMQSGGVLVCSVPKPDPKIVWSDYTHTRGFTSGALRSLVENSGFEVSDIFLMSGYTIAAKLGISKYLPLIGRIPILRNLFCSYHCIARKPLS